MEALALIAVAAAFGYLATLVLRRYEVLRSIAVEIDEELRDAFVLAEPTEISEQARERMMRHLSNAELRTGSLPPGDHERVRDQIKIAGFLARHPPEDFDDPPDMHLLMGSRRVAIVAAREVLAPLLLPPPLLGYRRAGKPHSYPDQARFRELLNANYGTVGLDAALMEALDERVLRYPA